jgi:hypothetical protein
MYVSTQQMAKERLTTNPKGVFFRFIFAMKSFDMPIVPPTLCCIFERDECMWCASKSHGRTW